MVLPVHDGAETLPEVLTASTVALDSISERWELVVVDDGSTDATPEILRRHGQEDDRVRVLTQHGHQGAGLALRRGFDVVRFLVVGTADGGGACNLTELATMYPFLREADLVAGFRQRSGSRLLNWVAGRLLGLPARDLSCPLRLYRRSLLYMLDLSEHGELLNLEILARAQRAGMRWAQVEVSSEGDRAGGGLSWTALGGLLRLRRSL